MGASGMAVETAGGKPQKEVFGLGGSRHRGVGLAAGQPGIAGLGVGLAAGQPGIAGLGVGLAAGQPGTTGGGMSGLGQRV
ncbi:hypothetical protein Tco_0386678 [Tanacetum coccineum]